MICRHFLLFLFFFCCWSLPTVTLSPLRVSEWCIEEKQRGKFSCGGTWEPRDGVPVSRPPCAWARPFPGLSAVAARLSLRRLLNLLPQAEAPLGWLRRRRDSWRWVNGRGGPSAFSGARLLFIPCAACTCVCTGFKCSLVQLHLIWFKSQYLPGLC